jgi:vacuolar-type H+-ATPase subunit I/STV1
MKRGNNLHLKEILSHELTLQVYKEEIAELLTQLSHALDSSKGKSFISEAEYFLDQLIITDESINKMRNNARELQSLIKRKSEAGTKLNDETLKDLHNFSKQVNLIGKNLSSLRDEFHMAFPSTQYDQKAA